MVPAALALAGLGLVVPLLVRRRRTRALSAPLPPVPVPVVTFPEPVSAPPVPPEAPVGPAVPVQTPVQAPPAGGGLNLLGTIGKVTTALTGGGVLANVGAVIAVGQTAGKVVEAIGGTQGQADAARVLSGTAPAIIAGVGTEKVLDALGIDNKQVQKDAGMIAGAAVLGGGFGAAGVGAALLADKALGLLGDGVQKAVHDVLRPFDVTNPNALAGKVVGAAADVIEKPVGAIVQGVGAVVKGLGDLFGGADIAKHNAEIANKSVGYEDYQKRTTQQNKAVAVSDAKVRGGGRAKELD